MGKHEKLFEMAKRAIQQLFGDRTVSSEKTIESLEALREEIDALVAALREDRTEH
jgi:hypothetical protein